MAIYRGSQRICGVNCAGTAIERIFNGSTLVFAAHDTLQFEIENDSSLPLSFYSGISTATPLAAAGGTSLVSFTSSGVYTVDYNAAGFYIAPVSGAEDQEISITLLNCRMQETQTLTLQAAAGGSFTVTRYGAAIIELES